MCNESSYIYHFDDFVLSCQSGGLDVGVLNGPAAPPDVGDSNNGGEYDQHQWEEEPEGEEEDVVGNVLRLGPGGGATHPIAL